MRNPEKHFTNFIYPIKEENTPDEEYYFNSIKFQTKTQSMLYKNFISANRARILHTITELNLEKVKNPKAWMPNFQGKSTWTNKELQWYDAERLLLFSCSNEEQCNKWVLFLSWAQQANIMSMSHLNL